MSTRLAREDLVFQPQLRFLEFGNPLIVQMRAAMFRLYAGFEPGMLRFQSRDVRIFHLAIASWWKGRAIKADLVCRVCRMMERKRSTQWLLRYPEARRLVTPGRFAVMSRE